MCDEYGLGEFEDYLGDLYDKQLEVEEANRVAKMRERITKTFEDKPKQGVYAHAYKSEYDNKVIYEMNKDGKSLQQIADVLGCSKSTIRNRLNKMRVC